MSKFERRYSEDQIDACTHAYLDRGIKPKRVILEQAKHGQLKAKDGRTLKPFEMNPASFNTYLATERKRRRGPKFGQGMDALDRPDDVMEGMRRRMIAVANDELAYAERQRKGKRDPEHLRQIARLMREVAALPGPKDGRSRQPGSNTGGQRTDGQSRDGMAGKLLAAHRSSPATEHHITEESEAENTNASANTRSEEPRASEEPPVPGTYKREASTIVAALAAAQRDAP